MLLRRSLATTAALVAAGLAIPAAPAHAVVPTTKLFFLADNDFDGESTGLYTSDADGQNRKALVGEHSGVFLDFATISPDGNYIAYERFTSGPTQIWLISAAGFDNHVLKTLPSADSGGRLQWSPDSSKLVFTDYNEANGTVQVVNAGTGATTRVPRSANVQQPTFDPSNPALLYGTFKFQKIVKMPLSGSSSPGVVSGSPTDNASLPVVSPDGQSVVFTHREADATPTNPHTTMRVLTAGVLRTLPGSTNFTRPSLSPDGATIYGDHFAGVSEDYIGDLYTAPFDGSARPKVIVATPNSDEYWDMAGYVDTTAPANPVTNLKVTLNGAHPTLTWSLPADATAAVVCRADGTTPPADPSSCGGSRYKGRTAKFTDTVTANNTYSYSVFATDGWGNINPTPTSLTMTALNPTKTTSIKLQSIPSTNTVVYVQWADAGPSGTTYDVVYGTKPGPSYGLTFKPWLTGTSLLGGNFGASNDPIASTPGVTYYFRAIAHDTYGNSTLSTQSVTDVPFDQGKATYSSGWANINGANRWLGSVTGSTKTGASAAISLVGSSYQVIGDRCSSCGQMRIYVSNVLKATINTYSPSLQERQVLWSSGTLGAIAPRTVKVVVVGTSGHPRVDLDGFATHR